MRMQYYPHLLLLFFYSLLFFLPTDLLAKDYPQGEIDPALSADFFKNEEKLSYSLSWSGGIQIGELHMDVIKINEAEQKYEIRVRIKDSGLFRLFYPVDDTFVTIVEGDEGLPVSYLVHQKEGSNYTARRHTVYNQKTGVVAYQKNEQPIEFYQVQGKVHNEFSSFFFTRFLKLDPDKPVTVPTFVEGKRHRVVVHTDAVTRFSDTLVGDVNVIPVMPIMKFKGLYEKDGDTIFWLTDDECRIPVKINSKLTVGSLTADLVSYTNSGCGDQSEHHRKTPGNFQKSNQLELGD